MKIKASEIRGLILVNREVISNISLKKEIKNPAMQAFIANKNMNALKVHAEAYNKRENDLKMAATNKDEKGLPITKNEGGLTLLDIPVELQEALQNDINQMKLEEVEVTLVPFSMEAADVICKHLSDTEELGVVTTGGEKTVLLLEKLVDNPQ